MLCQAHNIDRQGFGDAAPRGQKIKTSDVNRSSESNQFFEEKNNYFNMIVSELIDPPRSLKSNARENNK